MSETITAAPAADAATTSQTLVSIRALTKYYVRGDQIIPVLVDINLDVRAGDFVALMGPSGSGKSTLLNLIAGIDKPSSGELRIAGVDIVHLADADLAAWRAANIGFIFQFYNLMPVLTAYQNVELPLQLTSLSRAERRERVDIALALVGLSDRQTHYPNELSGGQQQRVRRRARSRPMPARTTGAPMRWAATARSSASSRRCRRAWAARSRVRWKPPSNWPRNTPTRTLR
jgi:putative ABC transport system ATP-binding protein